MIQKKLKILRKERGLNQKEMAKILSTDISSYSRKENGKSKIHDNEWEKLAKALGVSVDYIREEYAVEIVHRDNLTSSDNSGNYNQYFNISHSIIENLQDYIRILKQENESLKHKLENFKIK